MRTFMLTAAAVAMMATSAFAQAPMSTTTTTTKMAGHPKVTTTTRGPAPKAARTEASLACSTSANSKGLHKKDREKFMRECNKGK